ncbi:PhnD/SsuA/transferrin family substrate-binding protein [Cocleimonas sp. KMM 6892]|uniref:PhnD/SsuA/transferrin family substrate-binding protein n=2 Tax=Cocleimonas TaxID=998014 RepID=UPI002DBA6CBC|nr:PhnD/SsuA/transferrin family substrate-binding protein [Cocleimonas sp. KMM 6892]
MIRIVSLLWLLLLSMTNSLAYAEDPFIKIGVLSHRGDTFTLNSWGPTARYLTNKLPDYDFEIIPLDFDEVDSAVKNDEVDFILVNPGIYVNLEYKYRVSRLGTMYNLRGDDAYKVFGGVIFTRKDREDIQTLEDLHGKSFMAVDATSLGGFQMAWRELQAKGINPYEDFSKLEFGGIHDHVVRSVINGEIDAGTVRTDILERMSNTAGLDLTQVRIINPQTDSNFPFRLSTRLYPEWPFSKLQKTSDELAKKVALALFAMPKEHPAALAGKYAVWDLPLDYQQVHELFQELRLPPYDQIGKFTVKDVVKKYWYWGVAAAIVLLGMGVITSAVVRRNKRLKRIQLRMERHYERLLDSVGDGIYGVDLNGNCTFANKATENITGWKTAQLVGNNQHTILHHSHADGTHYPVEECPVYKTTNDSLPRFIDDDIFWKADGSTISVEYSCTPIKGPRNTTIGSAVVFRDITQRELVKKKTIEHQLQLFHVARLSTLGEMASGIAHELNQPLTVINNYSRACIRMLGSKDSTDESMQDQCSEVMEKISKQAERAGAVIKQIRHFVNKDLPDKKPVKVSEMLDVVLELTHMEIERKMVTLQLDIDDSVEWVLAQDTQIEQVIINLVRNAVEAMEDTPEGRRNLIIKTENQQDGKLKISISDSGSGIDKEVVEQLFDPFITTKEQGMGLGLSISQGIIETHDDKIIIEDNVEGGVCFSFKLPIVKSPKIEKENNIRKTKNKEVA